MFKRLAQMFGGASEPAADSMRTSRASAATKASSASRTPVQPPARPPSKPGDAGLSRSDASLVVPMIKRTHGPSTASTVKLSDDDAPVIVPLDADLVVMYAIDRPEVLEYLQHRTLKASSLSVESLHALAVSNLPSRVQNINMINGGEGLFCFAAGGNFEASLLFIDALWDQLAEHLPGRPLVAIPARDLLFAIGSKQPRASQIIREKAQLELADKRLAISQTVLERVDGRWRAFKG